MTSSKMPAASNPPVQIDLFGAASAPALARAEARRLTSARRTAVAAKGTASKAPQVEDETAMVERLERTGRYRVLRKLAPREVKPHLHPPAKRAPGSWPRLGVILDTETTGLDHAAHEIIELGMIAFILDAAVAGHGIAHLIEDRVAPLLADSSLIRVMEDWCEPFDGYYLYYPSRRQPSSAFALLLEALRYRD